MEEYEAYIDQLPAKIIKTLEEAEGHPPSEEELREIYEAHKELKQNVERLKQEINDKMHKLQEISDKIKADPNENAVDLVTELLQSCGIPCDEATNTSLISNSDASIVSDKNEVEAAESIENNEAIDYTDWEDGACGIDFKQLEELRENSMTHEDSNFHLTTRSYDIAGASSFNAQK